MNSKIKINGVTLTHAVINEYKISWPLLLQAAVQDHQKTELGGYPNGEKQLAAAYREILRECLVKVKEAAKDAYNLYCSKSVTTRGGSIHSLGHGSWSTGPDKQLQRDYMLWDELVRKLKKVCEPPTRETEEDDLH